MRGSIRGRLALAGLVLSTLGVAAQPAAADQPLRFQDTWTDHATDYTWPCGVPYTRDIEVTVDIHVKQARDGFHYATVHLLMHKTVTNPDNGRSVRFHSSGIDKERPLRDGEGWQLTFSGTSQMATVPGTGRAYNGAGRAVYDVTPLFDEHGDFVGVHEVLVSEVGTWISDPSAVCSYLAGD